MRSDDEPLIFHPKGRPAEPADDVPADEPIYEIDGQPVGQDAPAVPAAPASRSRGTGGSRGARASRSASGSRGTGASSAAVGGGFGSAAAEGRGTRSTSRTTARHGAPDGSADRGHHGAAHDGARGAHSSRGHEGEDEARQRRAEARQRRVADYRARIADDTRDLSAARDAARSQARRRSLAGHEGVMEEDLGAGRSRRQRSGSGTGHPAHGRSASEKGPRRAPSLRDRMAGILGSLGSRRPSGERGATGEGAAGATAGRDGTPTRRGGMASLQSPLSGGRSRAGRDEVAANERHRAAVAAAATVPEAIPGGARDPKHRNPLLEGAKDLKVEGKGVSAIPDAVAGGVSSALHDPESRGRRVLIALIVVAVAVLMLYGPLRNLYHAQRDHDLYEAQLAAIKDSNAEVQDSIDRLQTEEGIEDEARRHGYVKEGETAADVPSLAQDEGTGEAQAAPTTGIENVDVGSGPWYVSALDAIFGYDPSQG